MFENEFNKACFGKDYFAIEKLLLNGFILEPLHFKYAVKTDNLKLFQFLLSHSDYHPKNCIMSSLNIQLLDEILQFDCGIKTLNHLLSLIPHEDFIQSNTLILTASFYSTKLEVIQRILSLSTPYQRLKQEKDAFIESCYHGNIEIVKYLLHSIDITDPYKLTENKETVLHLACWMNENLDVIHFLYSILNEKIYEDGQLIEQFEDRFLETILHKASGNKNIEILKFILSLKEVNIHAKNYVGENAFFIASKDNTNIKILKYLHDHTDIDILSLNDDRKSPLLHVNPIGRSPSSFLNFIRYLFDLGMKIETEELKDLIKMNHKDNLIACKLFYFTF